MPGSKLAKACAYVLGQWPKLIRVFDFGEVELDTNRAEPKRSGEGQPSGCPQGEAKPSHNSVRPLVLGRKKCLRPCGIRLRRKRSRRSRGRALPSAMRDAPAAGDSGRFSGRALAPRRQLGSGSTRRRHRQRHRILKTPRDQSQGVPRRRPPPPGLRHPSEVPSLTPAVWLRSRSGHPATPEPCRGPG